MSSSLHGAPRDSLTTEPETRLPRRGESNRTLRQILTQLFPAAESSRLRGVEVNRQCRRNLEKAPAIHVMHHHCLALVRWQAAQRTTDLVGRDNGAKPVALVCSPDVCFERLLETHAAGCAATVHEVHVSCNPVYPRRHCQS